MGHYAINFSGFSNEKLINPCLIGQQKAENPVEYIHVTLIF